ncbi:MAG: DUF2189 domain-containing protein [Parvibaculum sp.]
MSEHHQTSNPTRAPMPTVRKISASDIYACLKLGVRDFRDAPLFGLVIGALVAGIGLAIFLGLTILDLPWMAYPFAIGFPLVGPFAAVVLYAVSRNLEQGQEPNWKNVLAVVWAQRGRELSFMAFVMLFVFWVWMYQIRLLIALCLGLVSFASFDEFLTVVFTTTNGWVFLGAGHIVGAALALILYSITVISMPLLLEREIDIVTAMITSVKTVIESPFIMLGWGIIVTLSVMIACLPFFAGLLFILPILGHTTWHIYRKAVVPA